MYTVKQLAEAAGVSPRTLRYYHHIGLLRPSRIGRNGYRYYDHEAALRLQQILFYRELGLELAEIREVVDAPDFDVLQALRLHRQALEERKARLVDLIETIERTVRHLEGKSDMNADELFAGFSKETQERYAQEARRRYGAAEVEASAKRWNAYTPEKQAQIMHESGAIYRQLAAAMDNSPDSPAVQELVGRWHQNLRHFFEPSPGQLRGLGEGYETDPEFAAFFQQMDPALPAFLRAAIANYCDRLEAGGP